MALFIQGIGYQQSGKTELAVANFQRGVKASNNNPIARSALGCALALSGNKPEALTVLQELENISGDQFVSPYCIAVIYAGLGMADEVFAYLNKAVDIKSAWMIHLHFGVDPRFTGFKNDIRYTELLKRIEMDIE
ncbi:MAG: hypothetical protein WDO19_27595 [Bacteroidota bacterium]